MQQAWRELGAALREQRAKVIAECEGAHAAAEQQCKREMAELASSSSTGTLARQKEQLARALGEQHASNTQDRLAAAHATLAKEAGEKRNAMESVVRQQIAVQSAKALQQALEQRAGQLKQAAQQKLASFQTELARRADAELKMQLHTQAFGVVPVHGRNAQGQKDRGPTIF